MTSTPLEPQPVMITCLRIKRCMRDENAEVWARALAEPGWWSTAAVLKDEPGSSWVRRATVNGREVVVKCRYLNSVSRRIKSALGFGHGDKHWRGAALLASKKIPTARPIVLVTAQLESEPVELLVLNYLSGPTLLEVLDQIRRGVGPGVRDQHRIAEAVGVSVGQLYKAKLHNRDHKPSNLIVEAGPNGESFIAIIDVVGIRQTPDIHRSDDVEDMFVALLLEPRGVGCPARLALQSRVVVGCLKEISDLPGERRRLSKVRLLLTDVKLSVRVHGDPRPAVNPLRTADLPPPPRTSGRVEAKTNVQG